MNLSELSRDELERYVIALESSIHCCVERAQTHMTIRTTNRITNGAEACRWVHDELTGVLKQHNRSGEVQE